MAHLAAIAFFLGLLIVLAVILEQIVKAHWTEIAAALRGAPVRPRAEAGSVARRVAA